MSLVTDIDSNISRELVICVNKLNDIITLDPSLTNSTRIKLSGIKKVLINLSRMENKSDGGRKILRTETL